MYILSGLLKRTLRDPFLAVDGREIPEHRRSLRMHYEKHPHADRQERSFRDYCGLGSKFGF